MMNIFLKNQIKKLTKNSVRVKMFREYKDIRQVMLLFNMEDLAVVESFVKTLVADGKLVTAYSFELNNNAYPQLPDNFTILNKENLNFFRIPKSAELSVFKGHRSDTLIDLTKKPSLILRFLFLNSPSDFRVGFNRDNAPLYDLLIEQNQEQDFSFFVGQMLFYMKSLRTK